MPVHLAEQNGKYCVVEPNGTVKKCYDSKQAALSYLRAINMNIKKSKADSVPALQIISDGTAEGTQLLVNGVPVEFTAMDFGCYTGEYGSCSMTVRVRDVDDKNMSIERSFTLRHYTPQSDVPTSKGAIDPEAEVRNRGNVVFPAGSKKVKDNKDHFPINDANQARNALSRVAQYSSVPGWYSGSLSELQSAVQSAVSRKFPGIKVTQKD